MKFYELKKLTDQIEEDTNRKIKLVGDVLPSGRAVIDLYLNDWLVGVFDLNEIYSKLLAVSFLVNALKFGKKPVEF